MSMTSPTPEAVPPRAHARIVYLGPVSPHWEVYGDWGDRTVLDEFRARVLARYSWNAHLSRIDAYLEPRAQGHANAA